MFMLFSITLALFIGFIKSDSSRNALKVGNVFRRLGACPNVGYAPAKGITIIDWGSSHSLTLMSLIW